MTVHYKGIEYKKDAGPWKVYVSDKSDNSSNNQPQVAQQNSLTEDDIDCILCQTSKHNQPINQSINSLITEMSKRTSTSEKHKAVKYT